MNLRGPSTQRSARLRQTCLPPGATRSASSSASRHPLPSLAVVMGAPERRNMPHLHPRRLNGGLWFDIHDCMRKDFWGPWWNYKMVPQSKKDSWWICFVMNLRDPSTQRSARLRQTCLPPGATRSASSSASRHPLPSLAAVMGAPERRNMPHLHPRRLNGGLWFDIHDCMRKDIVATWQSDFWGPWWNYKMVPQSKKDSWWICFVRKYFWEPEHHYSVLWWWEFTLKQSIGNLISKRRRNKKKPAYIGVADWALMENAWEEEVNKSKSETNSTNRTSDLDGLGMYRHVSGAKKRTRVAHEMAIENGGVPPSAIELVRRTHARKDGTFVDKRAEARVAAAEALARQRLEALNMDSQNESACTEPSPQQLTDAYIEVALNNKGRVYGLGSFQHVDVDANDSAGASLRRNMDVEMSMANMESNIGEQKNDSTGMKRAIEVILQINGVDPVTLQKVPRDEETEIDSCPSESAYNLTQPPIVQQGFQV